MSLNPSLIRQRKFNCMFPSYIASRCSELYHTVSLCGHTCMCGAHDQYVHRHAHGSQRRMLGIPLYPSSYSLRQGLSLNLELCGFVCLFVWPIQQAPIILLFPHPLSQSQDHKCLYQYPASYAVIEDLNPGLYPCETSTLTLQNHLFSLQRKLHFNVLHIQSSISPAGFPSIPHRFLIDFFSYGKQKQMFLKSIV